MIAPIDTWPEMRIEFVPLPWSWRLRPSVYVDDHGPLSHWSFAWLFLRISWYGQDGGWRRQFTEAVTT